MAPAVARIRQRSQCLKLGHGTLITALSVMGISILNVVTLLHYRWRRGVAVTSLGVSTKLLYVGPGYYWHGWPSSVDKPPQYFIKPPRPTQDHTLSGMGNEYQSKCGDALRLGSTCHIWALWTWVIIKRYTQIHGYFTYFTLVSCLDICVLATISVRQNASTPLMTQSRHWSR